MFGIGAVTDPPNVVYSKGNDDASHTYLSWESDLKKIQKGRWRRCARVLVNPRKGNFVFAPERNITSVRSLYRKPVPSSTTVNLVRAERCPVSLPQGLDKPPLFIGCVRLMRRAHSVGLRVNPSCVCVRSRFPGSLPCPRYPKKNNIFLMI